jgi:hypothetical protein
MVKINLSKASKMPCRSWSLEAGSTCPGSIDPVTKVIKPACAGCYAKCGNYHFPNVKRTRDENRLAWQEDDFVSAMVEEIDNDRYFRWFDSGDIYHPRLAEKIYQIMLLTPLVKHWLPTQSYNIPKIRYWLDKMQALSNVMVRFSSGEIDGSYTIEHGSTVVSTYDTLTNAKVCDAYERDGKCGDCRACWNKETPIIAYPAHGNKMKSFIKKSA